MRIRDGKDVDLEVHRELDDDGNDEIDVDACEDGEEDRHDVGLRHDGASEERADVDRSERREDEDGVEGHERKLADAREHDLILCWGWEMVREG